MNQKEVILVLCVVIIAFGLGLVVGHYYGLPFRDSGMKSDASRMSPLMEGNVNNTNTPTNTNRPR